MDIRVYSRKLKEKFFIKESEKYPRAFITLDVPGKPFNFTFSDAEVTSSKTDTMYCRLEVFIDMNNKKYFAYFDEDIVNPINYLLNL